MKKLVLVTVGAGVLTLGVLALMRFREYRFLEVRKIKPLAAELLGAVRDKLAGNQIIWVATDDQVRQLVDTVRAAVVIYA